MAPKAIAFTNSATPADCHCAEFRNTPRGDHRPMSNPEEREQESRAKDEDKFTEAQEQERDERSELVEHLRKEELDEGRDAGETSP
jgi:hypothetical protein